MTAPGSRVPDPAFRIPGPGSRILARLCRCAADFRERLAGHARQHRDGNHEWGRRARAGCSLARSLARRLHHLRPARCVDVDHPHAERRRRRNGLRDRIRDVVELEIEEYAIAFIDERTHDGGSFGRKQAGADLESACDST